MDRSAKNENSGIIYFISFNDHIAITIASHGHNGTNWQQEVCVTCKGFEIILLHLRKLLQTCCQDTADIKLEKTYLKS